VQPWLCPFSDDEDLYFLAKKRKRGAVYVVTFYMRLTLPFSHRVIRPLRIAFVALFATATALACWDYVVRREARTHDDTAMKLSHGLRSRVDGGYTIARTDGGRTIFRIHAQSAREFEDGTNSLEDVEITAFGSRSTERASRIHGKYCSIDPTAITMRCKGNVEFDFNGMRGHAPELIYDSDQHVVTSLQRTLLVHTGSTTAEADSLKYDLDNKLLSLTNDVRIQTGGILLTSASSRIRVSSAQADRFDETLQPSVEGRNHVLEPLAWTLDARSTEIEISSTGMARRVIARGGARMNELIDARRKLTGSEIETQFDSTGKFSYVEARGSSQMTFGLNGTLTSDRLKSSISGAIETSGRSVLRLGDFVVEGTRFSIRQGDIVSFQTSERAHLKDRRRESSADRTEALFDSRTNTLRELIQAGNLEFQIADYQGRAENGRLEPGGDFILVGTAYIASRQARLDAGQIVIKQRDHFVFATGNVNSVTGGPDEPIVITAARAQGGPGLMTYAGNVQLSHGNVQVRADRLQAFTGTAERTRFHAEGSVQSNLTSIRAVSPKLDYDVATEVLRHTGGAHLQNRGMSMDGREIRLKLIDGRVDEIAATGTVTVEWGRWRSSAQKAIYQTSTDSALLTGAAQGRNEQNGTIQGSRLEMTQNGVRIADNERSNP
jgi:lipopolysaccharide transport protein LptA